MEIANILTKYTIPNIKDLILEYAYKCECVGHLSSPHYCIGCIEYYTNILIRNPDPVIYRSAPIFKCPTTKRICNCS